MRAHDLETIERLQAENKELLEALEWLIMELPIHKDWLEPECEGFCRALIAKHKPQATYTCCKCSLPTQPSQTYDHHGPNGYGSGCCADGVLCHGRMMSEAEMAAILADINSLKGQPHQF